MTDTMLHIPVSATYRIINGQAVMIDADYRDVPADTIARLLLKGFGLPAIEEKEENNGKP